MSHAYVGGNRLIDQLPAEERSAVIGSLHVMPLQLRDPVFNAHEAFDRVVFPIDSVISVLSLFENGTVAEVASIGSDGFCPLEALADAEHALRSSLCQASGEVAVMPRAHFTRSLAMNPGFASIVRRYATMRLFKAEAIVACNAMHSLAQRSARWLLMMRDHMGRGDFPLTQEMVALMLGVRRAGVTDAMLQLKQIGAIRWRRSFVEIFDEAKLLAVACECYRTIQLATKM